MNEAAAGELLREWRQRRRMTQLDLACDAEISTRHLSFLETGRAHPSREMVVRLAERLEIPLRERNTLLVAAGFAPLYPERPLGDPALGSVQRAIDLVLRSHEPYPALVIDRHWTLVAANRAVAPFLAAVDPALLQPPVNVLRLSVHPEGLGGRIANYSEWHGHVVDRLRRQVELTADPALIELLREIQLRARPNDDGHVGRDYGGVIIPLELEMDGAVLSFFTMTTVFGTPIDITVAELALESFFPADEATARAVRKLWGRSQ
jgi:transcriptional regulator with XRE-family HTH domain